MAPFQPTGSTSTPTYGVPGDFVVNSSAGDLASLQGSTGLIYDFSFAGGGSANFPTLPLSRFELIAPNFSFDLSAVNIVLQAGNHLSLSGTGLFHLTGFTDTPGDFFFNANQAGSTFSFSASQDTLGSVPEPGSMMLLGTGLIGLAVSARRRLCKNA